MPESSSQQTASSAKESGISEILPVPFDEYSANEIIRSPVRAIVLPDHVEGFSPAAPAE